MDTKKTPFQAYKERRDNKIVRDFFRMRDGYASIKMLYRDIALRHQVSKATVQRALEAIGYDGIQGLRKPQKETTNEQ